MSVNDKIKQLGNSILEEAGGRDNIAKAVHCMTRVRLTVKDRSLVNIEKLKSIDEVMGVISDEGNYIQVVLGPGKARDVMSYLEGIVEIGEEITDENVTKEELSEDWRENKAKIKSKQKKTKFRDSIGVIADIFTPMIPAFIASGVMNGLGRLMRILMENGTIPTNSFSELVLNMVVLIGSGFLAYLVIFTGVNAAKEFKVNPMLGGMIGTAVLSTSINDISAIMGWFNENEPSDSILSTGAGGVIGVIIGVWILAKIEKWVHKKMPAALDISFTPLLSMIIAMPIFVLAIMPITGFISVVLANFIGFFLGSSNVIVRAITGYVLAALFLPLVLLGLHRSLTPIHTLQIEASGATTLFPPIAMAGAGQVGAAIALYFKAKRVNNKLMKGTIVGGLPAAILGIGEPLIYGVTLPLVKPFITAGLGAGFGGAYVMIMNVGAASFSPSGILAATHVLPQYVVHYLIGILISYIMGAVITYIFIPDELVERGAAKEDAFSLT